MYSFYLNTATVQCGIAIGNPKQLFAIILRRAQKDDVLYTGRAVNPV